MTQRWRVRVFGLLAGLWMVGLIAAGIFYRHYYVQHHPNEALPPHPSAWTPTRQPVGAERLPFQEEEVPEKRIP